MDYAERIRSINQTHDPRHIEAFMRVQFHTLDALSRHEFAREVRLAAQCVDEGGIELAEQTAQSFGL